MGDFLDDFASELSRRAEGSDIGLHRELKNPLLMLARVIAHGTERKNAPLATFIAGRYVEARRAQGADAAAAVAETLEVAGRLAPREQDDR